jgi:drug/metabolite transporter (DMT)-like permease
MRTAIALTTTILLWGAGFAAIRTALTSFQPVELAAMRYLIASAALAAYGLAVRPRLPRPGDLLKLAVGGILGIAVYSICLNLGERSINSGTASFLMNTTPIFTAGFGLLFLGERPRVWGWIGMAISVAGIGLLAFSGSTVRLNVGALYVLLAALSTSILFILQRPMMARYGPITVTSWVIWTGTVPLLPFMHSGLTAVTHASRGSLAALFFLGVGPAALAYVTWAYSMSRLPAAQAASFLYLVPPVATLVGFVWLGEIPTPVALIGGTLALGGVLVVNTLGRRVVPALIVPG